MDTGILDRFHEVRGSLYIVGKRIGDLFELFVDNLQLLFLFSNILVVLLHMA